MSRWHVSRWQLVATVQALDVVAVVATTLAGLEEGFGSASPWPTYALASGFVALLVVCVFNSFGLYKFVRLMRGVTSAALAALAWLVAIGPALAIELLHGSVDIHDRRGLLPWLIAGIATICGLRLPVAAIAGRLCRAGILGDRICVVGEGAALVGCVKRIMADHVGVTVLGYFGDPGPDKAADLDGVARLGGTHDATRFVQRQHADTIFVAQSPDDGFSGPALARQLACLPVRVMVAPWLPFADYSAPGDRHKSSKAVPLMPLTVSERPLAGWPWICKDALDRFLATVILIACAPLMMVIAAAILISDGRPVLFRQTRHGYGGGTFEIFKFRSMYRVDSATSARELRLTTRNDPRIFPIGRFLRRTSLDELPQLFNVIRGDMWVVGPRPHPPQARAAGRIYGEVVEEYPARHRIKPGITGWAQVNGWRGPTETLEQITKRVEYDLFYIDNWSIAFDLQILVRTLFCAFWHENAL